MNKKINYHLKKSQYNYRLFYILPFLFLINNAFSQSSITIGNTVVGVDTIYTGLDIPWEITYGKDNHIWVTERKGLVSRINPATKTKSVILDITSTVFQSSESGLLGLALHPDFVNTPEVFIAYTYGTFSDIKECLVKYTYNGSALTNPQILIDNIVGNTTHDGARLLFLADTTLLMSTGDAQNTSLPQDLNSLNGKILRLKTDGTIPSNNPFPSSYVYSYGHRNVQGMLLAPNGKVYLSEHGASTDDEFQILASSRNYGWPNVEGFCDDPGETSFCTSNNVVEPLKSWTPTIATSDLIYYSNPMFPEFDNSIVLSILKDKKLISLKLNSAGDQVVAENHYLTNMYGRLRDICVGANKEIYIATNGSSWSNTNPNTHSIIVLYPPVNNTSLYETHTSEITIYPNPFLNNLEINLKDLNPNEMSFKLVDISGRILNQGKINQANFKINTSDVSSGIYFIFIYEKNNLIYNKKIIK